MKWLGILIAVSLVANTAKADSYLLEAVKGPKGNVKVVNPAPERLTEELTFVNAGKTEVHLTHIRVQLPQDVLLIGPEQFHLKAGDKAHLPVDTAGGNVLSVEFYVLGTTDTLEVWGEDR